MSSSNKIALEDDQRFALMKFRRSVADVLEPRHDDRFLLRWLRARNWDADAAEKMLRQSLNWRKEWEVDDALKTWEPPEVLLKYHPSGTCGFDRDGCPVIVVPFAGLDVVGLLHSASRQELIKMTIQILERNLDLAAQNGDHKVCAIFDMEGFNLRQYAWRPAAELVIALLKMYEANYPEILKACYIINAPRVFAIAFNVVRNFLNDYTLGKIQIFKSDPKKWKKAILEHIDPDNLPKYLGGTLVDPDGNPRYTTKIQQGGKVPKSYYSKNLSKIDDNKNYTTSVIKKGDKLRLDFIVAEEGSFLRWDFKTDGHDIRFGVNLTDTEGNCTQVVRHKRISAHHVEESGVIQCQAPATYTVIFDNSYSIIRSKKIQYNVQVTAPLEKLGILPDEVLVDDTSEAVEKSVTISDR